MQGSWCVTTTMKRGADLGARVCGDRGILSAKRSRCVRACVRASVISPRESSKTRVPEADCI